MWDTAIRVNDEQPMNEEDRCDRKLYDWRWSNLNQISATEEPFWVRDLMKNYLRGTFLYQVLDFQNNLL